MTRIMIVGIGNLIMQDDAIGIQAVRRLQEMDLPEQVQLIDAGVYSYDLVDVFTEADVLLLIDAMETGGQPGTIYRVPLEELGAASKPEVTSLHELSFTEAYYLVNLLGYHPRVIVFGMEPKSLGLGLDLSPEVEEKMPRLLELVCQEARQWLEQSAAER